MNNLFVLYFLFLPFQFALSPVPGVDLASIRLLTLFLFLVWLSRGLIQRRILLPKLSPLFLFSGFLFIAFGSFLWSEHIVLALRKTLFLFSFAPLFIILASWFEEQRSARLVVLTSFVVGAFLSAITGIFFFLSQFIFGVERVFSFLIGSVLPFFLGTTFAQSVAEYPSLLVNISGMTVLRASGIFPDPHMFSIFIGMALPLALVFFLQATAPYKKYWGIVFMGILIGDLLSFSRGAYVALLGATVVALFASGRMSYFSLRQKWAGFIFGMVVLVMLASSPIGTRFFSSFSQDDGSNIERLRLWQEAVYHVSERPFFGVGLGNYAITVHPGASSRDPIYAHNLFLDIAVEIGLVGLFFFVALLGVATLGLWNSWKREHNRLAFGALISLSILSIHSLFETPLFSVHVLPGLLLLLSLGVSYIYDKKNT
jgi:hypothetical protein